MVAYICNPNNQTVKTQGIKIQGYSKFTVISTQFILLKCVFKLLNTLTKIKHFNTFRIL